MEILKLLLSALYAKAVGKQAPEKKADTQAAEEHSQDMTPPVTEPAIGSINLMNKMFRTTKSVATPSESLSEHETFSVAQPSFRVFRNRSLRSEGSQTQTKLSE